MSNILYNAYIYFMKLKRSNVTTEIKMEKVNIIGMFDTTLKIWYNGWAIYDPDHGDKYKLSKDLLIYGLNIERDMFAKSDVEKAMIKSMLVNSKFYINEKKTQLNVILALITYFLKAKSYSVVSMGSIWIYLIEVN